MNYPCPHCQEAECLPIDGTHWLSCPGCGRGYDQDDLAEYYSSERVKSREDRATDSQIRAAWDEQERVHREPGGGDDGLSMTWDVPVNEANQCIVSVKVAADSKKRHVIRVRGLACRTEYAQAAIAELIQEENP